MNITKMFFNVLTFISMFYFAHSYGPFIMFIIAMSIYFGCLCLGWQGYENMDGAVNVSDSLQVKVISKLYMATVSACIVLIYTALCVFIMIELRESVSVAWGVFTCGLSIFLFIWYKNIFLYYSIRYIFG
jgi:hypothetical protein